MCLKFEDVFRNTYLPEFLGLAEKTSHSETDLEEANITHLQNFLLEVLRGFCFEGRQIRFTFEGDSFSLLIFYNRLLKSYVLFDLKIGKLTDQDIVKCRCMLITTSAK